MTRPRPMDPSLASQTPAVVSSLLAGCLSDKPLVAAREIERQGLWEYLAAESCDAGVGGVLLGHMEQLGVALPASAARQLHAYREHVAAANAYRLAAIITLLSRLRAARVPYLLLKGVALNAVAYAPGERPMTDVDVLVHVADAERADHALRAAGCQPGADLLRDDFYPRYHCEREYFTPSRPAVKIDLHCRPFHPLRYGRTVPDGAMWSNLREVCLNGQTACIPGPQEMLIHLAVHAACHGHAELRWLYDIKLWLDRFGREIDENDFAARCRRWRLSLPVNRTLRMVRQTFATRSWRAGVRSWGAGILPAFFGTQRCTSDGSLPSTAPVNDDTVLDRLIRATAHIAGPLDQLALAGAGRYQASPVLHTLCNVLTAPGLRFRLGYLAATLLPGPAHLAQIYPHRHPGWQLAAHLVRATECIRRALARSATAADV